VFIRVDLGAEPPAVTLEEPQDCARFHVEVRGGDMIMTAEALVRSGVGRLVETDDALIAVAAVRSLAEGRVPSTWERDFEAMLSYARTKGWLSDDGSEIRAHAEVVSP
jgi:hypothetical protein